MHDASQKKVETHLIEIVLRKKSEIEKKKIDFEPRA